MNEKYTLQLASTNTLILLILGYLGYLVYIKKCFKAKKFTKVFLAVAPLIIFISAEIALTQVTYKSKDATNLNTTNAIQKKLIGNIGTPTIRVDTVKLSAHEYGKPDAIIYQRILSSLDNYKGAATEQVEILNVLNAQVKKMDDIYYAILPDGLYIQENNALEMIPLPTVNTEQLGWKDQRSMINPAKDNVIPNKILITKNKEVIVYNADAYNNYFLPNQTGNGDIGIWYSVVYWKFSPVNKTFELQENAEGNFDIVKYFNEDETYNIGTLELGHLLTSYGQIHINDLDNLTFNLQNKTFNKLKATYKVSDTYVLKDFVLIDAITIKWLIHKVENRQIQAVIEDLYFSNYDKGKNPEIKIVDNNRLSFKLYPTNSGKERYSKTEYNVEYSVTTGDVFLVE